MVDHVVLYRLRPEVDAAQLAAAERSLRGLVDAIPGVLSVRCGPNAGPPAYAEGWGWGFVMELADLAARDGYLAHPAHVAILPQVEALSEAVLVFDLERPGEAPQAG
jgi:stress responsive alpha/beta barrel protein